MEHCKISKILNDSTVSKFVTAKWIEVNDLSNGQYSIYKNISFKTTMLILDLCEYSGAYIVVRLKITVAETKEVKNLLLKVILHLNHAYQKLITHLNIIQKTLILLLFYDIWKFVELS